MLTPSGLSAAIKSAFIAGLGAPGDATTLQNFCDALANGLVPYLIANTVVLPGIAVQVDPGTGTGATIAPGAID